MPGSERPLLLLRIVVSVAIVIKASFWVVLVWAGPWGTIALTASLGIPTLIPMVVHLKPETESRLRELCATTGLAPDDLVEDAMAGYLAELARIRKMLDVRYDEIKNGKVKPIDGEEAFDCIRTKSDERRRP